MTESGKGCSPGNARRHLPVMSGYNKCRFWFYCHLTSVVFLPTQIPLNLLRQGLTPDPIDPDCGWLCGQTNSQMAETLSKRLEKGITARMVRYSIAQLKQGDKAANKLQLLARGWRKGRKRNQKHAEKYHPWAFIYGELLALTGLTARTLHAELESIQSDGLAIPARSTFFEHLKKYSKVKAKSASAQPRRPMLTELCTLRLHQMSFVIDPGKNYWLLLGAYETHTKFLNMAILDVLIDTPEEKKRGRPKHMPTGVLEVSIHHRNDGDCVELSEDMWWGFCVAAINKLGLPVNRIELVADFGLQLKEVGTIKFSSVYIDGENKLACYPKPDIKLDELRKLLARFLDRHNSKSIPIIETLRSRVGDALKLAREKRRQTHVGRANRVKSDDKQLLECYKDGEYNPPLLTKIACRPQRILGRMNEAETSTVTPE